MFDALTPAEWEAIHLSLRDRDRRHDRQPALRHRHRLAARPGQLSRPGARRRHRPSAAGHAAGRHRLSAAPRLRPARPDRRSSSRTPSASCSPSAGPARRLPAAIMGFPLMVRAIRLSIEAIDPRLESAASTLGASRFVVFADDHPAADAARHPRRHGPLLRPRARRVRRDHHLRRQHSRRDPDHPDGDLHLYPGARRRARRAPADARSPSPSPSPRSSSPTRWRAA